MPLNEQIIINAKERLDNSDILKSFVSNKVNTYGTSYAVSELVRRGLSPVYSKALAIAVKM